MILEIELSIFAVVGDDFLLYSNELHIKQSEFADEMDIMAKLLKKPKPLFAKHMRKIY